MIEETKYECHFLFHWQLGLFCHAVKDNLNQGQAQTQRHAVKFSGPSGKSLQMTTLFEKNLPSSRSSNACAEKPVSRLWAAFIQVSKHKRGVENALLECALTRH